MHSPDTRWQQHGDTRRGEIQWRYGLVPAVHSCRSREVWDVMSVAEKQNRDLLTNAWSRSGEPFNLSATMASGQAFRWRRDSEGIWWGVVEGSVVALHQEEGKPYDKVYWQTFPVTNQR